VIVLAAGRSSRAGEPKGLIDVAGRPWIAHQLEAIGRPVIVVLGHDRESYLPVLASFDAVVVVNEAPHRGPFSSVLAGARAASGDAFVLPIDVPCPGEAVWRALDAAAGLPGVLACVPVYAGRGGHPVRCARSLLDRLARVPEDASDYRLDAQLRKLGTDVARVVVDDPRVTMNWNQRADFGGMS
jgi:CTP:molybdopterin cytidylyltransferase MocA